MKSPDKEACSTSKVHEGHESATISKYFPSADTVKRKRDGEEPVIRASPDSAASKKMRKDAPGSSLKESPLQVIDDLGLSSNEVDIRAFLNKIQLSAKTPYQKRVLTSLCQVPRGQYTTYGALAKHLSSSPRAVGNALRNNPFAPQVPCHRVLATGGGLGGFEGSWGRKGEEGKNDLKKLTLLRKEGVKFDGKGKVVGNVWDGFV